MQASTLQIDTFHTAEEVANIARVHINTVRRALRVGELKSAKVGRQYRISKTALNDWMSANA